MQGPDGRKFPWGKIVATHEIGPYAIVEYVAKDGIGYHVYVDGKDTCRGSTSFDGALLVAIAYKCGDVAAAPYMARLIGGGAVATSSP